MLLFSAISYQTLMTERRVLIVGRSPLARRENRCHKRVVRGYGREGDVIGELKIGARLVEIHVPIHECLWNTSLAWHHKCMCLQFPTF